MHFFTKKYYKALSVYRVAICIGIFGVFVAVMTLAAMNRIKNTRYEVGLRQSAYVLSEALVFVNFMSTIEEIGYDVYYLYLIDTLNTKFESTNCRISQNVLCTAKEYKTLNGKSVISDEIFKEGEKIVIANMLFMINKPKSHDDALLISVDTNGGNAEPNKLGHDVFIFQIVKTKLKAMGNKDTVYPIEKFKTFCNLSSHSKNNLIGVNCTYKALTDPNYFSNLK